MLRPGRVSGFSLFELLVVLILLGIAAGLVMPSFVGGLGGLQAETAGRDLVTVMKAARSTAVAEQAVRRVILFDQETPDAPAEYVYTDEYEQPIKRFPLPKGISFKMTELPFVISFYSNGRSSGGVVVLQNEQGRQVTIEVSPVTGYGRVVKKKEDA